MSEPLLSGKVALVTGAGRGMGRAFAVAYAREGAKVVVADVDSDGGNETVAQIEASGGDALFVAADVSQASDVDALITQSVEAFGALDCACNNAAIELESAPLLETSDDAFDRIIGVNLKGVFLCMKGEIRQMLRQGGGTIVNIGSVNSVRPAANGPVYSSSKHGLLGLTQAAAIVYAAQGVRINMVLPGAIDTPMLAQKIAEIGTTEEAVADRLSLVGRFGRPEEVAEAVIWLSSQKASYVYGHLLAVDGGYLAR
jgi:NAD(P)-dependent dehydrogenase (short-subunit alcohol dehydrogenase family)